MLSLIFSLIVAVNEPSNFQISRLYCNDKVVAEYIIDMRTTKWIYINETWIFLQYEKNILAEYKPKKGERFNVVNTVD